MGLFDYYNDTCSISLYIIMVKKIILLILEFFAGVVGFAVYLAICSVAVEIFLRLFSWVIS